MSGPPVAGEEDEAASEASEWEAREQAERDWEGIEEEVRLGGGALRELAFFFFSHYRWFSLFPLFSLHRLRLAVRRGEEATS